MLFQGDLRQGWWLQLVCHVDVLLISPPCPAWSLANIAHDLSRDDGFLTIEILLKATVLQPSAIVLENVSNFMAHAHYPIVLDVLDWLGWKVEWGCKANLSDVLPQSRERSLLTLVRKLAGSQARVCLSTMAEGSASHLAHVRYPPSQRMPSAQICTGPIDGNIAVVFCIPTSFQGKKV